MFRSEVPNLGYICLSEGIQLRLAIEEEYIFPYLSLHKLIHISVEITLKSRHVLIFKYACDLIMINHFVIRNYRGTYSCVEILKGYLIIFRNSEGVHAHLPEC